VVDEKFIKELDRKEYVKLKYVGNENIVGRKMNNVQTAVDLWKS